MSAIDNDAGPAIDGFTIHPVAGRIGAEIRGLQLGANVQPEQAASLRQALLRYKVLFVRDQHQLDDAGQEAFARLIGDPVAHPTLPRVDGSGYLLELNSQHGGRANAWHTDVTFVPAYPQASILRAVVIPETGGDTVWANTAAAYEDLSPELRQLADTLRAVHSNDFDYAGPREQTSSEQAEKYRRNFVSTRYETEHPLVRVHPETGEHTLVLGQFLKRIEGVPLPVSQHLYTVLQGYVTRLENTVRWRWKAGDVAIWDNRATQHYAINDYGDAHRVVRRVTLSGDVPVGVDGRPSRLLQPAAPADAAPAPVAAAA